jgi:peptidyl-prolyl cis-trans isomerase D
MFLTTPYIKKDLPAVDADLLFNLSPGGLRTLCVLDYYAISKSLGKKLGEVAKASHILISYEGTSSLIKEELRRQKLKQKLF